MKVLILSCNTGGGHNACAKAICDSFAEKGISCTSVDALAFISGRTSSVMSNGHTWIYRHCPRLFSMGYARADKKRSSFSEGSAAYKFFAKSTPASKYTERSSVGTFNSTGVVSLFDVGRI